MNTDPIHTLNEQFAIPGHVSFHAGPGGLAMAVINNAWASGTMTLAGGHVMTFTPHGGRPLLWVAPNASYHLGQAMRGGIPVCWPWFGAHPTDPRGKPGHGLVRTMLWSLAGTRALPNGATELRMTASDSGETRETWPHPFSLELIVSFGSAAGDGSRLRVEWIARNPGSQPYCYTGALHPYFAVSDARTVTVRGLRGGNYRDKNDDFRLYRLEDDLRITGPVDAVFLDTTSEVTIEDPGWKRDLHIRKGGSRTTVVWNPHDKDALSPDIGSGEHRHFLCVEAANAFDDEVTVAPGGEGRLMMEIWAETR